VDFFEPTAAVASAGTLDVAAAAHAVYQDSNDRGFFRARVLVRLAVSKPGISPTLSSGGREKLDHLDRLRPKPKVPVCPISRRMSSSKNRLPEKDGRRLDPEPEEPARIGQNGQKYRG